MENEIMEMVPEEHSVAVDSGEVCGEVPVDGAADTDLAAENLKLRGELACAKIGVPEEIAGDIIAAAMGRCTGDISGGEFEKSVKEVYDRVSAAVGKSAAVCRKISTGVRSEKGSGVSDEALRRAFGLRNR